MIISLMRTNLPQLQLNTGKDAMQKEPSFKKIATPSRINVKGITLLDYFRMCGEGSYQTCIKETEEEERESEKSSLAETPSFNNQEPKRNIRIKIKTEISQDTIEANNKGKHYLQAEPTNRSANIQQADKYFKLNQLRDNNPYKKKQSRKKLLTNFHSNSNRHYNELTTSIAGYMSQAEDNKNKMLRKIELQRERINDLRLSDAFIVTKYGSKFRIDVKEVNKNQ